MFYILDTRGGGGGFSLWWRAERKGYTVNLDEAGLYQEEEARSIEQLRGTDRAVPEAEAREMTFPVVPVSLDHRRPQQRDKR